MSSELEQSIHTILDTAMLLQPITVRLVLNRNIGQSPTEELVLWYQGQSGSAFEDVDSRFYGIMQTQKMLKIPNTTNSSLLRALPVGEAGAVFFPVMTEFGYCGFFWACFDADIFDDRLVERFSGLCDWVGLAVRDDLQKELTYRTIADRYNDLLDRLQAPALIIVEPDRTLVSNPCFEAMNGRESVLSTLRGRLMTEEFLEQFAEKFDCIVQHLEFPGEKSGVMFVFRNRNENGTQAAFDLNEIRYYRMLVQKARGNLAMMDSSDDLSDLQKNYLSRTELLMKRLEALYNCSNTHYEKSGALGMISEVIAPQELVREVIMDLAASARSKHVEIENNVQKSEYAHAGSKALGDPWLLTLAIYNLVDNAVRYSKPEGKPVKVDLVFGENEWTLTVEDFGIGIAPLDLEQMQNEEEVAADGVLQGISFIRYAVRLHRGTLAIESRLGKGSRFTMTIPYY